MNLIFLGTGTSNGIPEIGCSCSVCTSANPKNRRLRSSVLVKTGNANILIDTTPDLRMQALQNKIDRIDAICYTHHHADHIFGIDDLRRFCFLQGNAIPCYVTQRTNEIIRKTFSYIFNPHPRFIDYIPRLNMHLINDSFDIFGTEVIPVEIEHGGLKIVGFRIGDMAYLTDCNHIPDSSRSLLQNLKVLILDALRPQPHISHFTIAEAIGETIKIGAQKTYFTHMAHETDHESVSRTLPEGISLAYDGLTITW